MPGLKKDWPEGAFYGFDTIYGADALDYRGPEFGWWRIPDQFSLAALDAREIAAAPAAAAVRVLPDDLHAHAVSANTAAADGLAARAVGHAIRCADQVTRSITETPQWTNMGESYAASVRYAFDVLAKYLRERPEEHFVLLVLGDHQPAANVSGEGAPWDVPVHFISDRPDLIDKLLSHGFVAGTQPNSTSIGPMHTLGPMLLQDVRISLTPDLTRLSSLGDHGRGHRPRSAVSGR